MERFWMTTRGLEPNELGAWVRYADAQRTLDAAQELSAAWAEKARQYELELEGDPQNLHGQGRTFGLRSQLATLQAQLADRDAMILQMGEQAAVLAKENMAVKAQLREVEGERNTLNQMLRDRGLGQGEIDAWAADVEDLTALRQLVGAFRTSEEWGAVKAWMVEGAPTRQEGVEAAKRITKAQYEMENALVACRQTPGSATLAAQDAGKAVSSG